MADVVLCVNAVSAVGAAVTATLPAAVGAVHLITRIEIELYATAARTGAAAPVVVTTTNMPGNPQWLFPTAQAIGTVDRRDIHIGFRPMQSSQAGAATTIVCPAVTGGRWQVNIYTLSGWSGP